MGNYDLNRFVTAQEKDYGKAFCEIKNGRKVSHWIWYIFPQLRGLGRSDISYKYGIKDKEEAKAYLNEGVLNYRIKEISKALIELNSDNIKEIMGTPDDKKLKSSMTLFDYVCPNDIFSKVLDKYYDGKRDNMTLKMLSKCN